MTGKTSWQKLVKNSISRPEQLSGFPGIDREMIAAVSRVYPMRVNPYYMGLIRQAGDPLWRQAIPEIRELQDQTGMEDPLDEENLSPVPNLVRKYPDRVLFLVSSRCSMYCRFCTRKRKVGRREMVIDDKTIGAGLEYIKEHKEIREVLLSGGDPLMLDDERLERILRALREIKSVEVIRIGTRIPCTLPMRVTRKLAGILKKYHPLYINTHFNHPAEITPEAALACTRLADAGIPLACQTVLLKGVNDDREIIRELMCRLLQIRVKPYYLFQADLTRGADHFRTPVATGLEIMRHLIGRVSGMAVPTFALDAPGGGGKIPLTPGYVTSLDENSLDFLTCQGNACSYPNPISEDR
ncbi:MAG: KamA family radical SAM protein [Desulfobulbaceae bacterium]|nr:KamA family radical SAM protein [Desulfobulbaceae bacterium]